MQENQTTGGTSSNGLNPMLIGGIIVAIILIAGAVLFVSSQSSNNGEDEQAMLEESMQDTQNNNQAIPGSEEGVVEPAIEGTDEAMMEENVQEFTLEAGSFYYKPNVIKVKQGDTVRVTIDSVDMMHDFVIDEFNAKTKIVRSGESGTVEFIADKAGSFEFYCSVGNHRAQGMAGTLTVE